MPAIGPTTPPTIQALLFGSGTESVGIPVSSGDGVALALTVRVEAVLEELGTEEVAPVSEIR